MLFLPSVALCCFSTAAVAMAAELLQDQLSLTSREDEKVSFSCKNTDQCYTYSDQNSYVFWYQKKETETFRVILNINRRVSKNCEVDSRYNHPQKDDFSAVRTENGCELRINKVKLLHSATYYCSCLKSGYLYGIFGSGTRLYVTAERVVKPKVSVYPASRADLKGKSSLLCLATSMFPPLVRFSWRREETGTTEGETVELGEPGRPAAILLIDREKAAAYPYVCSVKHQGGAVEALIPAQTDCKITCCLCKFTTNHLLVLFVLSPVSFQSQCRVKLLSLVYTVMIVKSMVYCCGLSLLMIHTNKGGSTNTHAD
ncbi:immunoglobulin lambda-1 light chain-like [Centroberyx gerrardi]